MKQHWKKILLVLVVTIAFINIISTSFYRSIRLPYQQTASLSNLAQVTLAALTYASDYNDKLPDRLSLLFPDYLDSEIVFYNNPSPLPLTDKPFPNEKIIRIHLLDSASPYRILHIPNTRWAIVHETPGIWDDGTISWLFLEKDSSGVWQRQTSQRGSTQEFGAAIKSKL